MSLRLLITLSLSLSRTHSLLRQVRTVFLFLSSYSPSLLLSLSFVCLLCRCLQPLHSRMCRLSLRKSGGSLPFTTEQTHSQQRVSNWSGLFCCTLYSALLYYVLTMCNAVKYALHELVISVFSFLISADGIDCVLRSIAQIGYFILIATTHIRKKKVDN